MTIDQMWERLAQHQSFANQRGYGPEWARMCEERTQEAAKAAMGAVDSSAAGWAVLAAMKAAARAAVE